MKENIALYAIKAVFKTKGDFFLRECSGSESVV